MFGKFRSLFILLSVCVFCSAALAQNNQTEARRQTALDWLWQLRDSLPDIENKCLRIHAQMQLADLLWEQDKDQARQLFENAFNVALKSDAENGLCSTESKEAAVEMLNRIAKRDAAWAEQLVASLPDGITSAYGRVGRESGQKVNLKTRLQQLLATQRQRTNAETNDAEVKGADIDGRSIRASLFGEQDAHIPAKQNAMAFEPLNLFDSASSPWNSRLDAVEALFSGDFSRAAQLGEMAGDSQMKAQFDAVLQFEKFNVASSAGNIEQSLLLAQSQPSLAGRLQTFINLAKAARNKKGAVGAIEILLIARQSVETEKESWEKAEAFALLAEAMIELDVERSFELAQFAIMALNAVEKENTRLEPENLKIGKALSRLSQSDFSRAWGLASDINNRAEAWFTKFALCSLTLGAMHRAFTVRPVGTEQLWSLNRQATSLPGSPREVRRKARVS